jgi:hypothetical protein
MPFYYSFFSIVKLAIININYLSIVDIYSQISITKMYIEGLKIQMDEDDDEHDITFCRHYIIVIHYSINGYFS